MLAKDTTPCKPQVGERERLPYIGMVMRTKIKEIIATGAKFGMRGDFFFPGGGGGGVYLVAGLLFILNSFSSSRIL